MPEQKAYTSISQFIVHGIWTKLDTYATHFKAESITSQMLRFFCLIKNDAILCGMLNRWREIGFWEYITPPKLPMREQVEIPSWKFLCKQKKHHQNLIQTMEQRAPDGPSCSPHLGAVFLPNPSGNPELKLLPVSTREKKCHVTLDYETIMAIPNLLIAITYAPRGSFPY